MNLLIAYLENYMWKNFNGNQIEWATLGRETIQDNNNNNKIKKKRIEKYIKDYITGAQPIMISPWGFSEGKDITRLYFFFFFISK